MRRLSSGFLGGTTVLVLLLKSFEFWGRKILFAGVNSTFSSSAGFN